MNKLKEWIQLIRDVGIILGIPVIISVGLSLHNQQIDALKAQLEFAESTRYDKAASILEGQEKVFAKEKAIIKKEISDLSDEKRALASRCLALEEELKNNRIVEIAALGFFQFILNEANAGPNKSIQPTPSATAD